MNQKIHSPDIGSEASAGSHKTYLIGYLASAALTLIAYLMANKYITSSHGSLSHNFLLASLLLLALIQLILQLVFFLHLGRESKPRWNLLVFSFMLIVLFILVGGSLWIMYNLNYHHNSLTGQAAGKYLIHDEGIQK
jgi:cytochrome o ubiquinol oxidase operon protein cyoD